MPTSSSSQPSADLVRQLLDAVKQGDTAAPTQLTELSRDDRDILAQTLDALAHLFRVPPAYSDRFNETRSAEQESLLINGLETLRSVFGNEEDDDAYLSACKMLDAHLVDVVGWMHYLFWRWASSVDNDTAEKSPDAQFLKNKAHDVIPSILAAMSAIKYSDIIDRLVDDFRVGALLHEILVISLRDDMVGSFLSTHGTRALLRRHGDGKKWESTFFQYLERRPLKFARPMIQILREYAEFAPFSYDDYMPDTISTLLECTDNRDTMLDACLQQDDTISAAASLFAAIIDSYGSESYPVIKRRGEVFRMVESIADFLGGCFRHGGVALVPIAMDARLINAIFALCESVNSKEGLDPEQITSLNQTLVNLVDTINPFIMYPSVFQRAYHFSELQRRHFKLSFSSPLKGLTQALYHFDERVDEEIHILRDYISDMRSQHPALPISSLSRFCDNSDCPLRGNATKLGICTICHEAYYCSRSCQKVVWKKGHRRECKDIEGKLQRTRKLGFPPMLTIHDREYIRRTLAFRYREWKLTIAYLEELMEDIILVSPRCTVITMDFTTYPTPIPEFEEQDEECGGVGPVIKAKVPTCKKLGDFCWISTIAGVPLDQLNIDGTK